MDAGRAEKALWSAGRVGTHSASDLLARVGVRAVVGDARATSLPEGCTDLIVSNNTLEHIPPADLTSLLAELHRVAAPQAVMDHFIDISDHYAHFDSSITEFNYLRYRPRIWRLFNNALQYQSRLRGPDYRRLIECAGFTVVAQEGERGGEGELAAVALAPQFRHYARDDLLVLRLWITAVA
jgi:hypothetical protein